MATYNVSIEIRGWVKCKLEAPCSPDPMLEQYFCLPLQQTQYHRMMNTPQWSHEGGKYPGSTYLAL